MSQSVSESGQASESGLDLTQFYRVFFEEADDNLANMESLLVAVDVEAPGDEALNAIFRCAHSIKGGAATFGFEDAAELTHATETLLDRLRRHELRLNPTMVDVLLEAADALRALLAYHVGRSTVAPECATLIERLRDLAEGKAVARRRLRITLGPLEDPAVAADIVALFREISDLGTIEPLDDGQRDDQAQRTFRVCTDARDDELLDLFGLHLKRDRVTIETLEAGVRAEPVATTAGGTSAAAAPQEPAAPGTTGGAGARPTAPIADVVHASSPGQVLGPTSAAVGRTEWHGVGHETTTLRVPVDRVDRLVDLAGEILIAQSMLAEIGRELPPALRERMAERLGTLEQNTRMLQEAVMAIRMVPVSVIFNRFPRLVRELAGRLGRDVELCTAGESTALDKGVIDAIVDPLTHLLRNAVDHGIESPDERAAAGKPARGKITLAASQHGAAVVIEVSDDGRGLERGRILETARARGLALPPATDGRAPADREVWRLIFEPGFTTAESVSDVSGRGVGMDVVRTNIAALDGAVELDSVPGQGTRVSIRLPVTLAAIDGLSVGVGDEIYVVPTAMVVESVGIGAHLKHTVGGSARLLVLRDACVPLVSLAQALGAPRVPAAGDGDIAVVVEADGRRAALAVDAVYEQQQVVVRDLESHYRKVPGILAATILGDGHVALILDVPALLDSALQPGG